MNFDRWTFSFGKMSNAVFPALVCMAIFMFVMEITVFPHYGNTSAGAIRVLIAFLTLGYITYWGFFFFKIYEVSLIKVPTIWTIRNGMRSKKEYYKIFIGHRTAFVREANDKNNTMREFVKRGPNALLFEDDIVLVAASNETYKEMRNAIREDRNVRGLRWNNSLPLGEGEIGFLNQEGHFYTVDRRIADKPSEVTA